MDQASVSSDVIGIIREELEDDRLALQPETALSSIPGWDSVTMSCVMIAIERAFDFEFDGAELDSLIDLNSLVDTVMRKRSAIQ